VRWKNEENNEGKEMVNKTGSKKRHRRKEVIIQY